MDITSSWFALYTQPHKENTVRDYLESEGLCVYLPEVRNKIQRGDRRSKRPFFPLYLFLKNPGTDIMHEIRWAPGLRHIVTFGGRAALVPDEMVEYIRNRLKTFAWPEKEPFQPGEQVRVKKGPFEGLNVVFDRQLSDKDRVRVFLELVSRIQVPVEMDLEDLISD